MRFFLSSSPVVCFLERNLPHTPTISCHRARVTSLLIEGCHRQLECFHLRGRRNHNKEQLEQGLNELNISHVTQFPEGFKGGKNDSRSVGVDAGFSNLSTFIDLLISTFLFFVSTSIKKPFSEFILNAKNKEIYKTSRLPPTAREHLRYQLAHRPKKFRFIAYDGELFLATCSSPISDIQ